MYSLWRVEETFLNHTLIEHAREILKALNTTS
jgi:hypothetical protein